MISAEKVDTSSEAHAGQRTIHLDAMREWRVSQFCSNKLKSKYLFILIYDKIRYGLKFTGEYPLNAVIHPDKVIRPQMTHNSLRPL
jgi:hypothetical protein